MTTLADWALHVTFLPITDAEGWADAPADAKEFTLYYMHGKVTRPALILKNDGKYNQVAIYASKDAAEPLCVLDEDVYTENCPDQLPTKKGVVNVVRAMRALEIAEDGSTSECGFPTRLMSITATAGIRARFMRKQTFIRSSAGNLHGRRSR